MMNKVSGQFVDLCLKECKKQKNKDIIKNSILDPLIMHILYQLRPIIIGSMVYFIATFLMIVALMVIILSGPVKPRIIDIVNA